MATFKTTDIERERPDEDFSVECESGNTYTLPHPRSIHGRDLLEADIDSPAGLIAITLGDADYDAFLDEPEIDGFALDKIFTAWFEHYGLPTSLPNGSGSPRRSTATDRLSKRTSQRAGSR